MTTNVVGLAMDPTLRSKQIIPSELDNLPQKSVTDMVWGSKSYWVSPNLFNMEAGIKFTDAPLSISTLLITKSPTFAATNSVLM